MSTRSQSTTSLISNHPNTRRKDYEAAFASLQMTYGASGNTPTPVHRRDQYGQHDSQCMHTEDPSSTSSQRTSKSRMGSLKRFFGSQPSNPVPVSHSSVTTGTAGNGRSNKNYENAFGDLQSSYGFGASMPSTRK